MPTRHLSLRVDADVVARLDAESRRTRQSRSDLVKTLLDEGLQMQAHPGIVFHSGPAGRRPALVGGPDVWEVVRVLRELPPDPGEESVRQAAELAAITPQQLCTALRYYAEHRDEVDQWIRQVDEEAERAEGLWRRERQLLGA